MPHVVVALDTGPFKEKLLKRVPGIVEDGDVVVLAFVIPQLPPGVAKMMDSPPDVEEIRRRLEREGAHLGERSIEWATSVMEGDPGELLSELAERLDARLLVVPAAAPEMERGRGSGYLARTVEERCSRPVLVVS